MFHGKGNDEHAIYMRTLTMTVMGSGKKQGQKLLRPSSAGVGGAGTETIATEERQDAKEV